MGYMSTNVFSTTEEGFARLNELIKKHEGNPKPGFEVPKFDIEEHHENGVEFGYDYCKFYGCWFDRFHKAWDEFVAEGNPYTMVRYGEDVEDIAEKWSDGAYDAGIPLLCAIKGWDVCV